MNNRFEVINKWFEEHSERDKLYMFLFGFVVIYVLYTLFFHRPISAEKKELIQNISTLQTQRVAIQQQTDTLNAIIKTPIFVQMTIEQKRLMQELNKMQQQIDSLKPDFVSENLAKLTEKILAQQYSVALISLDELPVEPWLPKDISDKTNLFNTISGIYQHKMQIEFQDSYFSTIDYFKRLENISKHMYWDSMEYKVLQYPKADVLIKFHVLNLQKS